LEFLFPTYVTVAVLAGFWVFFAAALTDMGAGKTRSATSRTVSNSFPMFFPVVNIVFFIKMILLRCTAYGNTEKCRGQRQFQKSNRLPFYRPLALRRGLLSVLLTV
jgi:hypothetical protein